MPAPRPDGSPRSCSSDDRADRRHEHRPDRGEAGRASPARRSTCWVDGSGPVPARRSAGSRWRRCSELRVDVSFIGTNGLTPAARSHHPGRGGGGRQGGDGRAPAAASSCSPTRRKIGHETLVRFAHAATRSTSLVTDERDQRRRLFGALEAARHRRGDRMIVTLTANPSVDRTMRARLPDRARRRVPGGAGSATRPAARGSTSPARLPTPASPPSPCCPPTTTTCWCKGSPTPACCPVNVPTGRPSRVNITVTEPDGTTTKFNDPGHELRRRRACRGRRTAARRARSGATGSCCPARFRRARPTTGTPT